MDSIFNEANRDTTLANRGSMLLQPQAGFDLSECNQLMSETQALAQRAHQEIRQNLPPREFAGWKDIADATTAAQYILSKIIQQLQRT